MLKYGFEKEKKNVKEEKGSSSLMYLFILELSCVIDVGVGGFYALGWLFIIVAVYSLCCIKCSIYVLQHVKC